VGQEAVHFGGVTAHLAARAEHHGSQEERCGRNPVKFHLFNYFRIGSPAAKIAKGEGNAQTRSLFLRLYNINSILAFYFRKLDDTMIEYIRGRLDELTPTAAIVEAAGVGYELFVSLNTYSAIQGKEEVKLFSYEVIREDTHVLFGFATKQERELFCLLLGVSGIGGQTARMLLSAFTPAELVSLIAGEDVRMLKSVKGIGPKAAQRIVVELKDKVAALAGSLPAAPGNAKQPLASEAMKEAAGALTTLGFPPAAVQKALQAIGKERPDMGVEELIKTALKML